MGLNATNYVILYQYGSVCSEGASFVFFLTFLLSSVLGGINRLSCGGGSASVLLIQEDYARL